MSREVCLWHFPRICTRRAHTSSPLVTHTNKPHHKLNLPHILRPSLSSSVEAREKMHNTKLAGRMLVVEYQARVPTAPPRREVDRGGRRVRDREPSRNRDRPDRDRDRTRDRWVLHTCAHTHTHTLTLSLTCRCLVASRPRCVYVNTFVYIYLSNICILYTPSCVGNVNVYKYIYMYVHIYIYMNMYIYIYMYIHIYIYIYTKYSIVHRHLASCTLD